MKTLIDDVNQSEELVHPEALRSSAAIMEALRAKIPGYQDQYIIWLDFSMFCHYKSFRIDGQIELLDGEGKITSSSYTDGDNPMGLRTRRPYPNKCICRIDSCSTYKKYGIYIYGVPMAFDSYKEIEQIKTIRLMFTYYKPCSYAENGEAPVSMLDICRQFIEIKTDFLKPDDNNKWYTISAQFAMEEWERDYTEDSFIVASGVEGIVYPDHDGNWNGVPEEKDIECVWYYDKYEEPSDKGMYISGLDETPLNQELIQTMLKKPELDVRNMVQSNTYYNEYNTKVYAKKIADIPVNA